MTRAELQLVLIVEPSGTLMALVGHLVDVHAGAATLKVPSELHLEVAQEWSLLVKRQMDPGL